MINKLSHFKMFVIETLEFTPKWFQDIGPPSFTLILAKAILTYTLKKNCTTLSKILLFWVVKREPLNFWVNLTQHVLRNRLTNVLSKALLNSYSLLSGSLFTQQLCRNVLNLHWVKFARELSQLFAQLLSKCFDSILE